MKDRHRKTARAIRHCLDSLIVDARRDNLAELLRHLTAAAQAADAAANAPAGLNAVLSGLKSMDPVGRC